MRIAFFVPSFPETSETFILRQVTGLLDRGHDVRIFAQHDASVGPIHDAVKAYALGSRVRVLPRRRGSTPRGALREAARCVTGILSHGRGFLDRRHLGRDQARAFGGWASLTATLAALVREAPFDVVHCHYGDIGLRYRVAARLWRAPLVVSFYGYDCSAYPRARGAGVFAPVFADADAVTSLSAHMDARLLELGCPARLLRRVPLSVDPVAFAPAEHAPTSRGAPVRILTVARLTEKKGVEFALRALALVGDEFHSIQYDVLGDGPLRHDLESLAASLGLGERVHFLGARNGEGVRDALGNASLFVLPSVTAATGDQEGTPTVLLEAACCGLPVVSTTHAGIPDVVRDGESGVLVPERDPEALAGALRRLLRTPERWAEMGAAGRAFVERYHATGVVAARLETLYAEVAASARGASSRRAPLIDRPTS